MASASFASATTCFDGCSRSIAVSSHRQSRACQSPSDSETPRQSLFSRFSWTEPLHGHLEVADVQHQEGTGPPHAQCSAAPVPRIGDGREMGRRLDHHHVHPGRNADVLKRATAAAVVLAAVLVPAAHGGESGGICEGTALTITVCASDGGSAHGAARTARRGDPPRPMELRAGPPDPRSRRVRMPAWIRSPLPRTCSGKGTIARRRARSTG